MSVEDLLRQVKEMNYESDDIDNDDFNGEEYTWSFDDFDFEYRMNCYCIQCCVEGLDKHFYVFENETSADFEYDVDKNKTIVVSGLITFNYKKKNYTLSFDHKVSSITLSSNHDISKLKDQFEKYIKENNPLKRKNLQVFEKSGELHIAYHPITPLKWESLIIDPSIKDKIWNNTIFQMDNLDLNNGIIFHGPPGLGKSSACKSLVYEAVQRGYSSCCVSSAIEFTMFGLFLRKYLSPCIVVFEDVDSFAGDREEKDNVQISDFLQLISGLSDDENKIIFIATTNFLKKLDNSIKSRPMRFNRKFLFDYPSPNELDRIVDLYFKDEIISPKNKALLHNCNFGGSHIKEIKRTCEILALTNKKSVAENFEEAVKEVKESFNPPKTGIIGFTNVAVIKSETDCDNDKLLHTK